jgi:hypothetical protein
VIQDLRNLTESLNNKLRTRKSLVYLINSYRFQNLFESADENMQACVLQLIKEEKPKAIKQWMQHQTGEHNLTELRSLAKRYSVSNYGRLSKVELIKALSVYDKILPIQNGYNTSIK